MRGIGLGALVALLLVSCGGRQTGAGDATAVEVRAERVGQSLRLEVVGVRRASPVSRAFEDPARWSVDVRAGGAPLRRVLNGSVRVARTPVGGLDSPLHDTEVSFDLAFAMPEPRGEVDIRVTPPGAREERFRVPVAARRLVDTAHPTD